MELGGLGAAIRRGDANEHVVGRGLRVLDDDVEVPVGVEDSGVDQLELPRAAVAPPVLRHERVVGERRLRIFVEALHVGVGRGRVEVEVVLLHVLAMAAAPRRAARGSRTRCTGIALIMPPSRPLSRNALMNVPSSSLARIFGAMPPPTKTPPTASALSARLPASAP